MQRSRGKADDPVRGVQHIAKKIDAAALPPLRFAYRDAETRDGGVVGTLTADPKQVDAIVTRTWQKIHNGNVQCAANLVAEFIRTFGSWMYVQEDEEEHIEPISELDVWKTSELCRTQQGAWMDGIRWSSSCCQSNCVDGRRHYSDS